MKEIKLYLQEILPKYNSNSKLAVLATGNDIVEVILSPQDQFKETDTIKQLVVDNLKLLQGKQSINKALEYIQSNYNNRYSSGNSSPVKIVVLTPGITDTTDMRNAMALLLSNNNNRNKPAALFTFVVFGDSYGTEKLVRPMLGTNDGGNNDSEDGAGDVIIEVPDSKLLPKYVDEIHGSIVNKIAGTFLCCSFLLLKSFIS